MNQMQVVDAFAWGWLALAALSTVYVAVDQFRGNPEATVMKWGNGADRAHQQLRRDDIRVGRKRIERLMRTNGWQGDAGTLTSTRADEIIGKRTVDHETLQRRLSYGSRRQLRR